MVGALACAALVLAVSGCAAQSSSRMFSGGASEQPVASASPSAASPGENAPLGWTATGDLTAARVGFSATLLPSGNVLVAGGVPTGGETVASALASAELYDLGSGTWTATGYMMAVRVGFAATLLPSGEVLVAGGFGTSDGVPLVSAELYDPNDGTWTTTANLLENTGGTATLLADGKVLVAGGFDNLGQGLVASAELYDPATETWTATGPMTQARGGDTATLLLDGRVLVVGGDSSTSSDVRVPSAELYDPVNGTWTTTGNLGTGRANQTATLLPDGRVLVTGGINSSGLLDSAELYDASSETWTATSIMVHARGAHTATLLPNGVVLVVGGEGASDRVLASAELYDPGKGS